MKRRAFVLTGLLAAPAIVRAQGAPSGVALVIGNSKYKWEAPLPNVRRDAPDVAKRFQAFGLRTELVQDASFGDMRRAIDKFSGSLGGVNFSVFYFAGHGIVVGENYKNFRTSLVPVDADLSASVQLDKLVPVLPLIDSLGGANHRMIVLDSCRNNPADGWRQKELARWAMSPDPQGSFSNITLPERSTMLYSTAPGHPALDGPAGENSPFASTFLRQFEAPSVDLQSLAGKLRRDLLVETDGQQFLWERHTYQQPYRIEGKASARQGGGADPARAIELPNGYALAKELGLPLPPGLVAVRPRGNARDGQKVGSFKFIGPAGVPTLVMILSADEQQGADAITASRGGGSPAWRLTHGTVSGDSFEYTTFDLSTRIILKWTDANSGSLTMLPSASTASRTNFTGRFTRLDG